MSKKLFPLLVVSIITATVFSSVALADVDELQSPGDTCEYGHFTVKVLEANANSEDFNENTDFSLYEIMDYTQKVPYADSYNANGATEDNNTSSMYILTSGDHALLIDLGNGAEATARHFGEVDTEQKDDNGNYVVDEAVIDKINSEYHNLIHEIIGDRDYQIAITHNHGDHTGYYSALGGEGLTVYFPEKDYGDDQKAMFDDLYQVETFTPGDFIINVGDVKVESISCKGHTDDSALFLIDTPVVTYDFDGDKAVSSSGQYILLTGDAIGSGSSVWLFSSYAVKNLTKSISSVYGKMKTMTNYDDYLGNGEKTDATLRIYGGHGWQYTNRFGDMKMDLGYIKSMKDLLDRLPEGDWVTADAEGVAEDGTDINTLLEDGKMVMKPANDWMSTVYAGTDLSEVAAVTSMPDVFNEIAGTDITTEEATE